jgi:hypothetical protein
MFRERNSDAGDPADLGQLPVARRRLSDADQLCHRRVEHAERINLTYTEMDTQSGRRYHPPAEARIRDRSVSVQIGC